MPVCLVRPLGDEEVCGSWYRGEHLTAHLGCLYSGVSSQSFVFLLLPVCPGMSGPRLRNPSGVLRAAVPSKLVDIRCGMSVWEEIRARVHPARDSSAQPDAWEVGKKVVYMTLGRCANHREVAGWI